MSNFNKIGIALTHVTMQETIQDIKGTAHSTKKKKNANVKSVIETLAKENGLYSDQAFLDDLSFLLNYGFQDQLEIQMDVYDSVISANLKRSCLREEESLMIRLCKSFSVNSG